MTRPLPPGLRERVVAAGDDGMSRRQAAERFGVGGTSAIHWCQRARETGSPKAAPQGGDRRSERIEAFGAELRYLPPRLQPDRKASSQLKARLRKAAERTQEGPWTAIGTLLPIVSSQHAPN